MSRINILPEHIANRIAAGEVIARPASVVKELVENAIDAGATSIKVAVERAGSRLIAVSDNGCGMDADDAMLSFEPHGTSKIREEEDIDRIMTLGFRGEAVPSIAAISRFTMQTRRPDTLEGTEVLVEGGRICHADPVGCAVGTTMIVRDLFFNTPARKKFLKSPATEENHIEEMLIMLALPYPEISFELTVDGRRAIDSPGAETPERRLRDFFGKNFAAQMLEMEHRENDILIHGFIGAPGFTRTSRREQRTFVNGRAVESAAIYRGIKDGMATLSEQGRYSPCVMFIQMSPAEVDVNVHPAKREVRFKQEFAITRAIASAVSGALKKRRVPSGNMPYQVGIDTFLASAKINYEPDEFEQSDLPVLQPEPEAGIAVPEQKTTASPEAAAPSCAPLFPNPAHVPMERRIAVPTVMPSSPPPLPPEEAELPPPSQLTDIAPEPDDEPDEKTDLPEAARPLPERIVFGGNWPTEVIGVLDRTYILASGAAGLVLIDQHAAHERILFEQLQHDAAAGSSSQPLLLPQTAELPRSAAAMLWRSRDLFARLGFDIEPLGNTTVMINAVPAALPGGDLPRMLLDILDELAENSAARLPLELEFVARAACKAAIKAHDQLTPELARQLLEQLGKCRQGTLCPHGRPTMLTITISEIARRFGRK